MDFLDHLGLAFQIASEPFNLFVCFVGVLVGTLTGVLPGLGSSTAIGLLLPLTYKLPTEQSIIMLAGIYYGAFYGGSTTSILLNVPGEGSSMITCLDGYPMAKQGRAGPALGISAFGSFIAGTFSILMLMIFGPILSDIALKFGPPEFVSITFLGLILVTYLGSGSMTKALMMACMGLLIGCVGIDQVTGLERYTGGFLILNDGIGLVPIIMGLFGVSEVLITIETFSADREIFKTNLKELLPSKQDWKRSGMPIARGTVLGFFAGLIPGGGGILSSLISYAVEKKISKHPEEFGNGAIEGVAGPETANNAGGGGSMVPLLTLGLPCNVSLAVLMGAFLIHGVFPGPLLIKEHPNLFWGVIGSMYVGNFMLLALNLPLIGLWVRLLKVPYYLLATLIVMICLVGSYSINSSTWDMLVMLSFGILGYLMKKFEYPAAPMIMALVIGPMFEVSLGQSLTISSGSFLIFFSRPISTFFTSLALILLVSPLLLNRFGKKRPGLVVRDQDV